MTKNSGVSTEGELRPYEPGSTLQTSVTTSPARAHIRRSSLGVKQVVHRSTSMVRPLSSRTSVRSWLTPLTASNRRRFVVLDGEIAAESGESEPSACPQRRGDPSQYRLVLVVHGHQAERPLTQTDRHIEFVAERQVTGVEPFECGTGRRPFSRQVNESPTDVDAVYQEATPGKFVRVPSWPATDIEHPVAHRQAERVDEEIDLLLGALGERIPQVGRSKMLGNGFKPMLNGLVAGAPLAGASLAGASLAPVNGLARLRFASAPRPVRLVAGASLAPVNGLARLRFASAPRPVRLVAGASLAPVNGLARLRFALAPRPVRLVAGASLAAPVHLLALSLRPSFGPTRR